MKSFDPRKIGRVVASVLSVLSLTLSATAAHAATSGSITPPDDVIPGTAMSYTLNDPDGTFCDTTNGTSVSIYVNFYNSDNQAVTYSYWDFTYQTAGTSYTWTDTMYFAYPGSGDNASRNWELEPRFTCYAGSDVTTNAPTVASVDYSVVDVSDNTPSVGDTVTAVVTDGDGAWCDSGTPTGGVVELTDRDGNVTTIPAGWSAGEPGLGSHNLASDETTVPFTIPDSLSAGQYTADVFCVEAGMLTRPNDLSAQFDLTVSAAESENLAATGANSDVTGAVTLGILGFIALAAVGLRARPRRS